MKESLRCKDFQLYLYHLTSYDYLSQTIITIIPCSLCYQKLTAAILYYFHNEY